MLIDYFELMKGANGTPYVEQDEPEKDTQSDVIRTRTPSFTKQPLGTLLTSPFQRDMQISRIAHITLWTNEDVCTCIKLRRKKQKEGLGNDMQVIPHPNTQFAMSPSLQLAEGYLGGNGLTRPVHRTTQEQAGNDRRGPARDMQASSVVALRQQILL